MCSEVPPGARAASIYGWAVAAMTCARTTRANAGHDSRPSTSIRWTWLGPTSATTNKNRGTTGSASSRSVTAMSTPSPRRQTPAAMPILHDRHVESRATTTPTNSEARPPHSHWLQTSWPMSLVPSRCLGPGDWSGAPLAISGSYGANCGAAIALAANKPSTRMDSSRPSGRTGARLQSPIGQFDEKIRQQDAQAGEQEHRLEDRVVARLDRLKGEQP